MSEARKPRRILRRIGAVLAGLVVVGMLDLGIDSILHATGVYPPWFQPMSSTVMAARNRLSHDRRHHGRLHRGMARARSTRDARAGAGHHRRGLEYCRRCRHLE